MLGFSLSLSFAGSHASYFYVCSTRFCFEYLLNWQHTIHCNHNIGFVSIRNSKNNFFAAVATCFWAYCSHYVATQIFFGYFQFDQEQKLKLYSIYKAKQFHSNTHNHSEVERERKTSTQNIIHWRKKGEDFVEYVEH